MKTNTIFYKKRATILACATLAIPRFATDSISERNQNIRFHDCFYGFKRGVNRIFYGCYDMKALHWFVIYVVCQFRNIMQI